MQGEGKFFLKAQKLSVPVPLETTEQQNVVRYVRFILRKHGLERLFFSIPNEGVRDKKNRSRLLCEGMTAGVPDLFLAISCGEFHGLFIEMKRRKSSHITEEQKFMINLLKSQCYRVEVCKGFDEAKAVVLDYLKNSGLLGKFDYN